MLIFNGDYITDIVINHGIRFSKVIMENAKENI